MPLTHTHALRVRYDECDVYGHVNNAAYLRYMQEAAFEASAAAGYDLARYAALGRHWLVQGTQIDYLRPLRYGDQVLVTTWVEDFARVRSRRRYDLRLAAGGEPVAQAYTDWVFLETATGRPAAIPPELAAAFFPEGAPPALKRAPFPDSPPPSAGPFRTRLRVPWRDVDAVGMVNNPHYLSYVEEAGLAVSAAHGWPAARLAAAHLALIVRRHRLEYRRPAGYGDELEIATWASEMGAASATRHYVVTRPADGDLVARVNSQYVWVDARTLRPIRIPADMRADFAPNLAP